MLQTVDLLFGCLNTTAGGFAYASSNPQGTMIFGDGHRLSRSGAGDWQWTALPDLPVPVADAGLCAIGSTIYMSGGADFNGTTFCYDAACNGSHPGLGRQLYSLDVSQCGQAPASGGRHCEEGGWVAHDSCPGTPRAWHQMNCVDGQVVVIGGSTNQLRPAPGFEIKSSTIANVVDNWSYNTRTKTWKRLRDLPTSGSVFGGAGGGGVFDGTKILLVNAYQYDRVRSAILPQLHLLTRARHTRGDSGQGKPAGSAAAAAAREGAIEQVIIRPAYGVATHAPAASAPLFARAGPPWGVLHSFSGLYFNDVFVYDVATDLFGFTDRLPINNASPSQVQLTSTTMALVGPQIINCNIAPPFSKWCQKIAT